HHSLPCPFSNNEPPTTHLHTLSLHDALPISDSPARSHPQDRPDRIRQTSRLDEQAHLAKTPDPRPSDHTTEGRSPALRHNRPARDRKSTRLNSSHVSISYAVFCLKKKKNTQT